MAMNEAARQVVVLVMLCASQAWGHGYVRDPPQRSSMWRFGYDTDANYDDMALNCGGFSTQWEKYGGKCGICGDSYGDSHPRENEAGGKYASGIITRTYKQGQVMDVTVQLSANHQGYFLFKVCPNNNVKVEATQECLDSNVLTFVDPINGQNMGEKYYITGYTSGRKRVKLQLPSEMTCTQCVMQWTYYTGNRWGCNNANDTDCCVGCGPKQENFVNCVDIAIISNDDNNPPQTLAPPKTTTAPPRPQPTSALPKLSTPGRNCRPVEVWKTKPGLDKWCAVNCAENNCPPDYCTCDDDDDDNLPQTLAPPVTTPAPPTPQRTSAPTTPQPTSAPPTPQPTSAPPTPQRTSAPTTPQPTSAPPTPQPTPAPPKPQPTSAPPTPQPTSALPKPSTPGRNCRPVGVWKTKPGLDKWCAVNCAENNCPPDYCTCD